MKKKKIYIALLVVSIILFFYWQKEKADDAQSIKNFQFQSAIGFATDDLIESRACINACPALAI